MVACHNPVSSTISESDLYTAAENVVRYSCMHVFSGRALGCCTKQNTCHVFLIVADAITEVINSLVLSKGYSFPQMKRYRKSHCS